MHSPSLRRSLDGFPPLMRELGRRLWQHGAAQLEDVTETVAKATVELGRSRFAVRIEDFADSDRTSIRCSCQPQRFQAACAHACAALLALDELLQQLDEVSLDGNGNAVAMTKPRPRPPTWRRRLGFLADAQIAKPPIAVPRIEYYVEVRPDDGRTPVRIHVRARSKKKNGELSGPKASRVPREVVDHLPRADQQLLMLAHRAMRQHYYGWSTFDEVSDITLSAPWDLSRIDLNVVLPELRATGRAYLAPVPAADEVARALQIDVEPPYVFQLATKDVDRAVTTVHATFVRGDECLTPSGAAVRDSEYALVGERLIRLECHGASPLASELLLRGPIEVPRKEVPELLSTLARTRGAAQFLVRALADLPASAPVGVLLLNFPSAPAAPLRGELRFDYGGQLVDSRDEMPLLASDDALIKRDTVAEHGIRALVLAAGVQQLPLGEFACARDRLAAITITLGQQGIRVLAEGKRLRPLMRASGSVRSGIDWFEVGGAFEFDGRTAALPELLRRKLTPDGFVELDDGTLGMLPATWLRQVEALRLLGGEADGEVVKLPNSQALLLDAMLAAREQDDFAVDEQFAALRSRLAAFTKVVPASETERFRGTLRPYQREGLGWLQFLREFGLGGCLADDMGLGKTVQVLALLLAVHAENGVTANGSNGKRRRAAARGPTTPDPEARRPSLLVAPRSVLGNWLAEVRRFAPGLRVLDFSGVDRWRDGTADRLADHDLVLTTYALVRADAPQFDERQMRFHYAILDEAQAIKNGDSLSSKAVRLLHARHRLVLTGTPVENHLGDLWSLFEFLNPGMLGRLPAFRGLFGKDADAPALAERRALVQRALRPVLLRRTKAQVLTDLPDKIEQTLWCELGPAQRKRYDDLKRYYRDRLLGGSGPLDDKQRFVVLEALLRLRQASCHEGLLDPRAATAESAKFEELLPRLEELAAEGHKALVFSQFTSLLDLLERQLRLRGMTWERLDGKTTRRAEHVERFQTDAKCPLFLISLKAGGYGLNLTAAGYVFLLDPWWNPAVEMQAIDRAHRIGQTRTVNAYRLVCRGTVEERVLELQAQKKALCEAILGNERSLLQDLSRADLELLLG